jgi:cobalamin biosynthesis protein CobD/CbiB
MEFLDSVISTYPELMALTLVLLVEWIFPLSAKFTPAFMFNVLATSISNKIVHSPRAQKRPSTTKQQVLAGWLALGTYLFLIATIIGSILFAVTNDVWTQAILLYFALGYQTVANQASAVQTCISQKQKSAAKTILAHITEFDTDKLTELGVNKLTLESVIKRFVSFWLLPIILFLLFDGFIAIMYRALLEAYIVWQPKNIKFKHFGQAVFKVKNTIELLPRLFIAPIYSVFKSSPSWSHYVSSVKEQWKQAQASSHNQLIWLSIVSAGCKSELAGPLMLQQQKIARPRINQGAPLFPSAIGELLSWNNRFRVTFIIFNIVTISLLVLTNVIR